MQYLESIERKRTEWLAVVGKGISFKKKFEEALLITHQLQCNNFKTSKYKNNSKQQRLVENIQKYHLLPQNEATFFLHALLRRTQVVNIENIIDF